MEKDNMISKYILLTGAGFTHNFGTPLADEMWSTIFNDEQIQAEHNIKKLMKHDCCDYEKIYNIIMDDYSENEKKAFKNALISAYNDIDSIIINFILSRQNIIYIRQLIRCFSKENRKCFFFTLNQDLFIERLDPYNRKKNWMKLRIPGMKNKSNWFSRDFIKPLETSDYCKVPNEVKLNDNLDSLDGHFFYVKLHGSCNWIDSNDERLILTGNRKTETIRDVPILKYNYKIFENVLFQPKQHLLIIGYGFGDVHINAVIANAVKKCGLKLFIISPKSYDKFCKELINDENIHDILQSVSGYCPYKLTDIFINGRYRHEFRNMINNFFEKKIIH